MSLYKTINMKVHLLTFICLLYSFLGSSSATSVKSFEQEVLNAHNYYRARHNAPPLELDAELSKIATEWAQHLLANNRMEHRPFHIYGENIYMASGGNLGGSDAVRSWYSEINQYNWNNPSFQMNTGHFTQVVWKNSQHLGVGFARRGNTIYIVCNYDPSGNYMGEFQKNVSPPNEFKANVQGNILTKFL